MSSKQSLLIQEDNIQSSKKAKVAFILGSLSYSVVAWSCWTVVPKTVNYNRDVDSSKARERLHEMTPKIPNLPVIASDIVIMH